MSYLPFGKPVLLKTTGVVDPFVSKSPPCGHVIIVANTVRRLLQSQRVHLNACGDEVARIVEGTPLDSRQKQHYSTGLDSVSNCKFCYK